MIQIEEFAKELETTLCTAHERLVEKINEFVSSVNSLTEAKKKKHNIVTAQEAQALSEIGAAMVYNNYLASIEEIIKETAKNGGKTTYWGMVTPKEDEGKAIRFSTLPPRAEHRPRLIEELKNAGFSVKQSNDPLTQAWGIEISWGEE